MEWAQLPRLAQAEDAFRALAILSKHPRIDPARIMVMGFSRGGQNALYASLKRFHRLHASPGTEFAAYNPPVIIVGTPAEDVAADVDKGMTDVPLIAVTQIAPGCTSVGSRRAAQAGRW